MLVVIIPSSIWQFHRHRHFYQARYLQECQFSFLLRRICEHDVDMKP